MGPAELWALHDAWERREARWEMRFGMILALLANVHRDPAKGPPVGPEAFFPHLERFMPKPDPEAVWSKLDGMAATHRAE